MKAVFFERKGGPDVLEYRDAPDPVPTDEKVVVEVEAVGVNFRDVYERERPGYGSNPPAIVGIEGAGHVVDTGERVGWVDVFGSYAERVLADPRRLVPIPEGVSSELAAAVLLQGMTAHYLSHESYPVQKGDWVIVHAGAGGVGLLLIQMAKMLGGNVIATTSTDEKAGLARGAGADHVLRYEGFAQKAREISGEGVAAVYDGVGKTTFYEGLAAMRPLGRMISYGSASGQPDPVPVSALEQHGSLYVQRPTLRHYTRTTEMLRARARAVLDMVASGRLNVRIGARYRLADARQAHIDLEARKTTGKLLLIP
ncbi:MAG TPA: quinone oxidoreductase [Candidatus Dormibacteraeota bacterium]|nr:quinone oxidoreductase [Candidatus Dormibacteraeota bacterium]